MAPAFLRSFLMRLAKFPYFIFEGEGCILKKYKNFNAIYIKNTFIKPHINMKTPHKVYPKDNFVMNLNSWGKYIRFSRRAPKTMRYSTLNSLSNYTMRGKEKSI